MGRILKDGYRERVKLATKLPVWKVETRQNMDAVLDMVLGKNPGARICISAIALETLSAAVTALTAHGLTAEVTQIGVSRTKTAGKLHLLMANNPVFLISAGPSEAVL